MPISEPICPDIKVPDGQKAHGTYGGRKRYRNMKRREDTEKIATRHG
jgi:hypothetical protein